MLRVGDLCSTIECHPSNRNLLVTVTGIDEGRAPTTIRVRRLSGEPFPVAHVNGKEAPAVDAWCTPAKLRRIDLDDDCFAWGLADRSRIRAEVEAWRPSEEVRRILRGNRGS